MSELLHSCRLYIRQRTGGVAQAAAVQAKMDNAVTSGSFQQQVISISPAAKNFVASPANNKKPACIVGITCRATANVWGDPHIR